MESHPSGHQFEIRYGAMSAVAVEVGGGLRSLRCGSTDILDGFPEDEMCHDARGDVLMPWPNRLAGGSYEFDGEHFQLPINETSHNNAIHGLVRWAIWRAVDHQASSVTMAHDLYPQPGYPFALQLQVRYTLGDDGLVIDMSATNAGSRPCPLGVGQHPYVRIGTEKVDEAWLQIPAASMYRYNDQLVPTEKVSVGGTPLDFRRAKPIGSTEINMDFTDLVRDADGLARVRLSLPSADRDVTVWLDSAFRHATIYTGETVQPVGRRRQGLAVEPMTCPPNAFVTGNDLNVLNPGETWRGTWGLTVRGFQ